MNSARTALQTSFTIAPTSNALEEHYKAELAAMDQQIADLAVEMQALREDLAFAQVQLAKRPVPKYSGRYETAREIELSIAAYFDSRINIIVPNVSWGLFNYEMDIVVLKPNGDVYEIEIKISKSDLRADNKKRHQHRNKSARRLYFAIPEKLKLNHCIEHIPERAGILVVDTRGIVTEYRKAEDDRAANKFDDKKRITLARLGALRVWNLKRNLLHVGDLLDLERAKEKERNVTK